MGIFPSADDLARKSRPGAAGLVTIFAENRAADLWLEWHGVVPAAVVADDLEPRRRVLAERRFF